MGTVPSGVISFNGRPFGLHLIARSGDEARLLQLMEIWNGIYPNRPLPVLQAAGRKLESATMN